MTLINSDVCNISDIWWRQRRFAGVTRIGDPDNADPTSAAATGVRISNNGLVKIKKSAGGSAISVIDENNATNVLIGSTGNATFAGSIQSGGDANGGVEAGARAQRAWTGPSICR